MTGTEAYYLAIDRIVVANCRIPNAMVLLLPADLKLLHLALFLSPFLVPSLPDSVDYSIYHQKIGGRGYVCNLCGKESKQKVNSINHINSKHISVDYICPICQYVNMSTKQMLLGECISVWYIRNPRNT